VLDSLALSSALEGLPLAVKSTPWPWILYAIRAVVMGLGLACLGFASMMYEDEEGRLQNRIDRFQRRVERWWIKIDDRRMAYIPRVALFIREVAKLAGRCFDRILTKHLLSIRVVGVSVLLSMASPFLAALVLPYVLHSVPLKAPGDAILEFVRLTFIAFIPAFSESPSMPLKPWLPRIMRFLWWVFIIRMILSVVDFLLFMSRSSAAGASLAANAAIFLPLTLGFSASCDVAYILFTRWTLRRISATDKIGGILLWILLLLLFLALILVVPPFVGIKMMRYSPLVGGTLLFSILVNSIDAVILLATLMIAVFLLVHRLMWPLIQRPLYAIQRLEIVDRGEWKKRKKWLWAVGVFLIAIAIPGLPSWLKDLFDKI
jgi:hypothetical protein